MEKTYEQKRKIVKDYIYPMPTSISEQEWVESLYNVEMEYRNRSIFWRIKKFVLFNLLGQKY